MTVDPKSDDWFVCPNCGKVLIGDPTNCSHCGADDKAGWTSSTVDGVDLPDDEFDYDEFLHEELGIGKSRKQTALWFVVGLVLALVAMLMLMMI